MEKFWRILRGLVIVIGLPVGCSYELYKDSMRYEGGVFTVILVAVISILIWVYIIHRWLKK